VGLRLGAQGSGALEGHHPLTAPAVTPSSDQPAQADNAPGRAAIQHSSLGRAVVWALAVVAGSAVVFGIHSPIHLSASGMRGAVEMLIASSALLGAAALFASFRQRHQRRDLLLLVALAAVGLTDFVFSALPAMAETWLSGFGSALQVACAAWVAVAFAAAAFARVGTLAGPERHRLRLAGIVAVATIALAPLVDLLVGGPVLGGTSPQTGIDAAAAHPVLLVEALFSSAVFLVAGVVFFGRPERDSHVLAGAAFLLAAAGLQYLSQPVTAPDWVTSRDGLRLLAYVLLLAVALGRYAQTRRTIAAAALAIERERIARDLHDGLAQDLAFIAVESQQLSPQLGDEHPLTIAARRAVAASRGVIVDLSASTAANTDVALCQVADELAARFGIDVDVRLLEHPEQPAENDFDTDRREELVRIAREAIVNAARHGGARHVAVVLDRTGDQSCLRVSDDGRGFSQTGQRRRAGFGLQMMRARTAALGGHLVLRERTQGGAELEVTFPHERATRR
jgi:signal transduction histidine kinase